VGPRAGLDRCGKSPPPGFDPGPSSDFNIVICINITLAPSTFGFSELKIEKH